MAYVAVAPCLRCGRMFGFNPHRVPSILMPETGQREPLCGNCLTVLNEVRRGMGLDPYVPLPGAYEPAAEFGDTP